MQIKQKKIFLVFLFLLVIVVAAALSYRYLPLNRLLKVSSSRETVVISNHAHSSDAPNTLLITFEPGSGVQPANGLYSGIAHSGKFSSKAFGSNSFSTVVERKAGDVGVDHLDAVALSAWIYVFPGKAEPKGSMVFSASNNGVNVAWKGITLQGKEVPRGKWFKISGLFEMPDVKFKPDFQLQLYFWNNSSTDILVDDYFVVFGGAKERKGDSTLVDVNKGTGWPAKFNYPPFPFQVFHKNDIHNDNSAFLAVNGSQKEGDISPDDLLLTGHFTGNAGGTEDLFVVKKTGIPELFTWCREKEEFRKVNVQIPAAVSAMMKNSTVFSGSFTEPGNRQLFVSGPQGAAILGFDKKGDPCQGQVTIPVKMTWNSASDPFSAKENPSVTVADLDGDQLSEVLVCREDGTWSVFKFDNGSRGWKNTASGDQKNGGQWNPKQYNRSIHAGHFMRNYSHDILLTVYQETGKKQCHYSLLRYDAASHGFISCMKEKEGKIFGRDTLKPADQFLCGNFDPGGLPTLLRYNRDWRYDLKSILFSDSTYQILSNIDFEGYDADHNPKYFEALKLCSGEFIKPGITSLLLVGKNRNHKGAAGKTGSAFINLPELPNIISVYSLKAKVN